MGFLMGVFNGGLGRAWAIDGGMKVWRMEAWPMSEDKPKRVRNMMSIRDLVPDEYLVFHRFFTGSRSVLNVNTYDINTIQFDRTFQQIYGFKF